MYSACQQLSTRQLQDMELLYQHCRQQDGGSPLFYPEHLLKKRSPQSNWLYTIDDSLYASASVFYFYDEACEISLLVHPDKRQQGIASELLRRLYPLLVQHQMQQLIFTLGAGSPHWPWLRDKGLLYKTSEYHMRRQGFEPHLIGERRIKVRRAKGTDLPHLCQIDSQCFNHRPEMLERYSLLLHDPRYALLVAQLGERVIGKAHINWQSNEAVLSDIGILPLYQKQGFGGELLASAIEKSLKEGCSVQSLSVETGNSHALALYQRFGFQTIEAFDYGELDILALERHLKPG
ncbi:MAG: GNAT family N-acetyltransferase [Legionellaceae bacterium]|nr:GNAT family N-acetyltransferase [Legionellaceae bacterium]